MHSRLRSGRLRRMTAATAAAVAALGAAVACSSGAPAAAPSDTIRIGTPTPPAQFDSALSVASGDQLWLKLIYDRLIDLDPTTQQPIDTGLAKSWAFSGDNLTMHVTLRDGVAFQDGTPLNAAAVKTSLDRFQKIAPNKSLTLPTLSEVVVVDDLNLDLKLSAPDAFLPQRLSDQAGEILSPKAIAAKPDNVGADAVGAGPYRLTNYVPGSSVTLTRNDQYWGPKPAYRTMQFTIFANTVSMVQAFQASQLDFIVRVPFSDQKTLEADDRFRVAVNPSGWTGNVDLSSLDPKSPVHDIRVRKAIDLALDRSAINELATEGHGVPLNQTFVPGSRYYSQQIAAKDPHDVDEARKLVAEVYPNGVQLKCITYTGSFFEPTIPTIIGNLKAVGIDATIQVATVADGVAKFSSGEYPCYFTLNAGQSSAELQLSILWAAKAFVGAQTDPAQKLDQNLLTSLKGIVDPAALTKAVQDASLAAHDTYTAMPLFTRPTSVTMVKGVTGYVPNMANDDVRTLAPASAA